MPIKSPPPIKGSFAEKLLKERNRLHWKQITASDLLEISDRTYGSWERGKLIPDPKVQKVALARLREVRA